MKIFFNDNEYGFTLIELMVGLAISTILALLIGATYISFINLSKKEQNVVKIQQDTRSVFFIIERDLFQAGYQPDPYDPAGVGIRTASANVLEFSFVVNDDNNDFNIFNYSLNGDELTRTVKDDDDNLIESYILAKNIEQVQFFYTFDDMRTDFQASGSYDNNNIIAVSISILARSEDEIKNYSSNKIFRPLSNGKTLLDDSVDNTTWQNLDPDDHHLRKMLTSTIYLRNMGLR